MSTSPTARIPWADADHRNHPDAPHHCRCVCFEHVERRCPEHGWMMPDPSPTEVRRRRQHAVEAVLRQCSVVPDRQIRETALAVLDALRPADLVALLEQALHLRQNGERAPGAPPAPAETWAHWDRRAGAWLRDHYQR